MSAVKAGKRPLRSLTAHEKLEAIRRVHDGESKASVARDIGVPESTLRGWCKNEDKILYLSIQSSPDTDESTDSKSKRAKLIIDEISTPPAVVATSASAAIIQPFNLSIKSELYLNNNNNNNSGAVDYSNNSAKNNGDQQLLMETNFSESNAAISPPKNISERERERNRAELARLSVDLGLNRPEMFNNLADLTANIGLLTQWNNLLLAQNHKTLPKTNTGAPPTKITAAPADTSSNIVSSSGGLLNKVTTTTSSNNNQQHGKLPKEKQSVEDSVWYWLKTQQNMLNISQQHQQQLQQQQQQNSINLLPTSSSAASSSAAAAAISGLNIDQSSWFWKWYKQIAYGQLPPPQAVDKPILYQQLTIKKEKDCNNAENLSIKNEPIEQQQHLGAVNNNNNNKNHQQPQNNKVRAVLDNLLFNNNNNVAINKKDPSIRDEDVLSQSEALEHGEKFLKWLEACSEPSVTAMQIMQFRSLMNNIKAGADRKNGDLQKAKVKRK